MILLLSPPLHAENYYGKLGAFVPKLPHLGLTYIAAVLEKNNLEVQIIDAELLSWDFNMLRKKLVSIPDPKLVGITCVTATYSVALKTAKLVKESFPQTIVVMGGPHVSTVSDECLESGFVDVVVKNEGEYTFLNIAKNPKNLRKIKGISYIHKGRILHNPDREFIENLDILPFPARHLTPRLKFRSTPDWPLKYPADVVLTIRGCSFNCTFCYSKMLWGKKYRSRSVNNVVDEIEFLVSKYAVKEILFQDDLFFPGAEIAFSKEMIKRGLHKKIKWLCETRIDLITEDKIRFMEAAGCKFIFLGVEAADEELLKQINKGFNLKQVKCAFRILKKSGITTRASFIIGLPGETRKQSYAALELAKELDPDFVKFNLYTPFPTIANFKELKKQINNFNWEDYISIPGHLKSKKATYVPKGRSFKELCRLQKEFHQKFYLRPRKLWFFLRTIKSFDDIKTFISTTRLILS